MRITNLQLTSFRSFEDEGLNLNAPRVFVGGVNGAGKSTIREAIKWALTGRCQGLDGKGAGAEKLVPSFSQQSHTVDVRVLLQDTVSVHRTWAPGGSVLEVDGFTGTSSEQQKALYEELLKVEPAYLDAALDSRAFLDLHHADAKRLVLQLLNVQVDVEARRYTLDELDQAYEKEFKNRKAAKDKVKGAFVPPMPSIPHLTLEKKTLADKDEHLKGIDSLLATLRQEIGTLQQQMGGTVAQRRDLQKRLDGLKEPIFAGQDGSLEQYDALIHDLEERLAIMEDTATAAVAPVAPAGALDINAQKVKAERLRAFDPKHGCVLDGHVKCPVGKVMFFGRARDIEDAIEKLSAPVPVDEPVVESPKTSVVTELSNLQGKRAVLASYLSAHADYIKQSQELRAELAAVPVQTEIEAAIAQLQERVTKGEDIQKAALSYYAQLAAVKQALEHRATLEAEVARLEALVDVLGPNGARVQALAKALEPFQTAVNGVLKDFGWSVTFQVDPWQVFVNGRPVDTYSKSEQHRVGIALQMAIAQLSGLGFAVIDELDMLTVSNRETLGRLVFGSKLDQVLILSSREPDVALPDAARIQGMIAMRLGTQDGRSVVLESIGEGVAA